MVGEHFSDALSTVEALRAAMALLGIAYVGLELHESRGTLKQWEGVYDLPAEGKLLVQEHPGVQVRRIFTMGADDAELFSSVIKPLKICSPELIQALFETRHEMDLSTTDTLEGVEFESSDQLSALALSDADLECPECGHLGMDRTKSWPAVCLEATRAMKPSVELTSHELRSLVNVTMSCPNCTHAKERPVFLGLKERAMAEMAADRMNLSLPIAAPDLRALLQAQSKAIYNTAELLWLSIEEFLVDLDDVDQGKESLRYARFVVAADDAPPWMQTAIVQLEHLGWIENIEGDVFRKTAVKDVSSDPFSPPLIEHVAFPVNSRH